MSDTPKTNFPQVNVEKLRDLVKRIEAHEAEKAEITSLIKDVYVEAKAAGFDTKILRQLIRLRRKDTDEVEQQEVLLHTYQRALD